MTAPCSAEVLAVGLVTPVGLTARSTAAALRAGIVRVAESPFRDRRFDPIRMGLVPEAALPPLAAHVAKAAQGSTALHRRLLRLAALALEDALSGWPHISAPLLLALPEPGELRRDPISPEFVSHLVFQTGDRFETARSRLFRHGRAGGLLALQQGLELLASRRADTVCIGGVDSYLDLYRLTQLDSEGRLALQGPSDGFIPGEGAAFLILGAPGTARRLGLTSQASVLGIGTGIELGHLYSAEPHRGDGLADALRALFAALPRGTPRTACVYAGFTGESLWSKEWGVAYLRNAKQFKEPHRIEHPVDCIGDPGAALGPLLMSLAAIGIGRGYRPSPCLVWCGSDNEARAATLLHRATQDFTPE